MARNLDTMYPPETRMDAGFLFFAGYYLTQGVDMQSALRTIEVMAITFTQHALLRMNERGISQDEVLATLASPLRTIDAQNGRKEAQGWIDRLGKRQLLRVLYEGEVVVMVVTVMATSKFEKYGVQP